MSENTETQKTEEFNQEPLKVSPQEAEPFKKPVYKSIHGEKTKTAFKGARVCSECGKPTLMRMQEGSKCLNCGYSE